MASRPSDRALVQSTAQLERDDALHRIGRTRRVAIAGAAALTAGIAAFVSAIAPGRTLGATKAPAAPASTSRSATSTPSLPPLESGSQLGLVAGSAPQPAPSQPSQSQPPPAQQQQVQPPPVQQAPVQQAPPVVSGGS